MRVWTLHSPDGLDKVLVLKGHKGNVRAVSFSKDGMLVKYLTLPVFNLYRTFIYRKKKKQCILNNFFFIMTFINGFVTYMYVQCFTKSNMKLCWCRGGNVVQMNHFLS